MKKEASKQKEISNRIILQGIVSLGEQFTSMQDDLRTKYATKDDLFHLKEELLAEIRPIARAVDKDAHTVITHEKRLNRLEKHAVLK